MDPVWLVDRAVKACRTLVGTSVPGIQAAICAVFWYGAVDISPEHCVVWVIIDGKDENQVPEWYFPSANRERSDTFAKWAAHIEQEVLAEFAKAGWKPSWPAPRVGFESEARVRAGGGYQYFK